MYYKIIDERLSNPELDPPFMKPSSLGANSVDLRACIPKFIKLRAGEQKLIPTGIQVALPEKSIGMLLPRSGLGSKGLVLGNLVGNIDPDYRGEIKACLWNRSDKVITIRPMDRIAQFVVTPVFNPNMWEQEDDLDDTERGEDAFGSTGME